MKICTRCGYNYQDHFDSCPNCGLGDSGSTYRIKREETLGAETRGFTSQNITESIKPCEERLTNGWKVFITSIICLVPFIGQIIGLMIGAYFQREHQKDTKTFGKSILILSLILLLVHLCLGIIGFVVYKEVADDFMYFLQLIQR